LPRQRQLLLLLVIRLLLWLLLLLLSLATLLLCLCLLWLVDLLAPTRQQAAHVCMPATFSAVICRMHGGLHSSMISRQQGPACGQSIVGQEKCSWTCPSCDHAGM
jgi:hypothetical protein